MRPATSWWTVLFAVLALGPVGAAAELKPAPGGGRAYGGPPGSRVGKKPAKALAKEPTYKSKNPLYVSIDLGKGKGRYVIGALDESKGTGSGHDTLYLDANNNGDLTDDARPKVNLQKRGTSIMFSAPKVPLTVKYDDGSQCALSVMLMIYKFRMPGQTGDTWYVRYQILEHLQGTVDIGGKKVLAAIYDAGSSSVTVNGCFDDYGTDGLRVDVNGDGQLAAAEQFLLSKVLSFGGKLWSLSVNGSGTRFSVKPYAGPTGRLKISAGYAAGTTVVGGRVSLVSKGGCAATFDLAKSKTARLPADSFQIAAGTLMLKDKAGGNWVVHLSGSQLVKVAAGGTAELKLGAPIKVEPVVSGRPRAGGPLSLSQKVVGAAGEVYSAVLKNGRNRTRPPEVTIADAKGAQLAKGSMRYG